MDLSNFGPEQLENRSLHGMLKEVGIDDVGSFVDQFRAQASGSGKLDGGGESLGDSGGDVNLTDGMVGASPNKQKSSGGSGGWNIFNQINSARQNAQQMYAIYKQLDRNSDGKIAADDIEVALKEIGFGTVSPYLAKALFEAVDQNHNGALDFTDLMALVAVLEKLYSQYGIVPK